MCKERSNVHREIKCAQRDTMCKERYTVQREMIVVHYNSRKYSGAITLALVKEFD